MGWKGKRENEENKNDDIENKKLGKRESVGEWRIEEGDKEIEGRFKLKMIGEERKEEEWDKKVGRGENIIGKLSKRENEDDMRRRNRIDKIGIVKWFRKMCEIGVEGGFEILKGGMDDELKKKKIDEIKGEGEELGNFGSLKDEKEDGRFKKWMKEKKK